MEKVKNANKDSSLAFNLKKKSGANPTHLAQTHKLVTEKIKKITVSETLIRENIDTVELTSIQDTIIFRFLFAKILLFCCFRLSKI